MRKLMPNLSYSSDLPSDMFLGSLRKEVNTLKPDGGGGLTLSTEEAEH